MAANQAPIFGLTPRNSFASTGTAANTNKDGTATVATIITAGVNGTKIERVFLLHLGANTGTVVRFFINNGSANSVAANNSLVHEETLASWVNSETAASTSTVWNCNLILAAGYKLNVTIGTAVASGVQVTAEGSDF